jgi:hypothetical protein
LRCVALRLRRLPLANRGGQLRAKRGGALAFRRQLRLELGELCRGAGAGGGPGAIDSSQSEREFGNLAAPQF